MTQKTLWEDDLADLKTPKHDEIVLGLTKEVIAKKIEELGYGKCEVISIQHEWVASKNATLDLIAHVKLDGVKRQILYFEVKTVIPSYGELMRQINHYRNVLFSDFSHQNPIFLVVSPDDRFKDAIQSQKLIFWKWTN